MYPRNLHSEFDCISGYFAYIWWHFSSLFIFIGCLCFMFNKGSAVVDQFVMLKS